MRVPAGDYDGRSGEVAASKGVSRGRNPAGGPAGKGRLGALKLLQPRVTGVAVAGG